MKRLLSILPALICLVSLTAMTLYGDALQASQRYALVIGNSGYISQPLLNPRNDANDMAAQLQQMGYEIYGGGPAFDLDRTGIERTLRAFAQSLPENAHALFYYAGHGMSTSRDNYLIPIDHKLEFMEQLPDRAVSLRSTVDLFKNANPSGINVVLLDACRDNPLTRNFRSTSRGLQKLRDIPRGIFIGYAADDGQVAEDGTGRNGTYTEALLGVMKEKPGIIIEVAHKNVAGRVFDKTNGKQFPVSEHKVYGDWCFGQCDGQQETGVTTQLLTDSSPAKSAKPSSSNKLSWKLIGGVVLGIIVVGAALQGDDGPPENDSFQLIVEPP